MIKGMKTLVLIAILVISLSFVYADCIPNEKLAGSQTINDVKFKTITTNLNQTTSEYIQTIQVLNTAKSVKNISYTKYSCRCQKTIGNGNNKICIAYWPDDLFNCHGIEESLSLAPGETEIIEISVSQYQNKVCGTFQTDLWINSINGKNFNKLSVWALAHLCEDCSIERCEEEKSCLTPDDYGITSSVKIKPSGERTLQKYLDDAGVKVNVSQQDNIQTWDFKNPGNVTLEITYIGGHTNHQDIFGYKVDSGNFTTIGDLKTIGSQIITLSGDNSITFGIKDVNLNKIRYTEKSLNENTENYTVTYSLCDNTYAIGFEDYADFDYQDLIVLVKVLGCEQKCISTEEVCEGLDNNCNGEIDEGYVETETSCGVGECARTGLLQCISGEEVDSCVEGDSETEVCDGLDNNCNGVIDENPNSLCDNGLFCDGQETCSNGGCIPGQLIDCTNSSILIDNCTNNPDSNQFTFDFYEFPSSCDEELQGCIQKPINWLDLITHECSKENCGAECDAQNSCSDKEGNKTFYDTCDEKMLVDYNNNNNLDNETISASCSRDCNLNSCGCGDCDLTFEDLIPETKCVLGVCGAT
ncbi:MAG: MopE-related protein, partial [Candidatus Pacearchaeota archaeon]|nr:MopE-related protein [Candidatus Pacearchaeota archaeon]